MTATAVTGYRMQCLSLWFRRKSTEYWTSSPTQIFDRIIMGIQFNLRKKKLKFIPHS